MNINLRECTFLQTRLTKGAIGCIITAYNYVFKEMNGLSSAFRNFFITFALCMLAFGLVGFKYIYPWIGDQILGDDTSDNADVSDDIADVSGDTSDTESGNEPVVEQGYYNPDGDVFTAVIMCVDEKNCAVNCVFIDSNEKTKQFIYCPLSVETKRVNEIGVIVPLKNLFSVLTPEEICNNVTSMTGIDVDYCLIFDRTSLSAIASCVPNASISLGDDEVIEIDNPAYKDYVSVDGTYPADYRIQISNIDGKVNLNEVVSGKTKLEWLLDYAPQGKSYYSAISKALLSQFLADEKNCNNNEALATVINACKATNMTESDAKAHRETIFSLDTFQRHNVTYPANWETAVEMLRDLDGSYDR